MAAPRLPWVIAGAALASIAAIVVLARPAAGARHPEPRPGITAAERARAVHLRRLRPDRPRVRGGAAGPAGARRPLLPLPVPASTSPTARCSRASSRSTARPATSVRARRGWRRRCTGRGGRSRRSAARWTPASAAEPPRSACRRRAPPETPPAALCRSCASCAPVRLSPLCALCAALRSEVRRSRLELQARQPREPDEQAPHAAPERVAHLAAPRHRRAEVAPEPALGLVELREGERLDVQRGDVVVLARARAASGPRVNGVARARSSAASEVKCSSDPPVRISVYSLREGVEHHHRVPLRVPLRGGRRRSGRCGAARG